MIAAIAGKPSLTSLKPHQKLEPDHRGLAIVVTVHSLWMLRYMTRKLGFAVYEPQDKISLNSYMQTVDHVELNHHPIIVAVDGFKRVEQGRGNLLLTDIGHINVKEDIMAPLFPPIATHLADNPKIFLFVSYSGFSERYDLHSVEAIGDNYIVGYVACNKVSDEIMVTRIVWDELASPSMSVQEIFTSIHDKLPPHATMTVIDRLKEPVYLHPREPSRFPGILYIVTCLTSCFTPHIRINHRAYWIIQEA